MLFASIYLVAEHELFYTEAVAASKNAQAAVDAAQAAADLWTANIASLQQAAGRRQSFLQAQQAAH